MILQWISKSPDVIKNKPSYVLTEFNMDNVIYGFNLLCYKNDIDARAVAQYNPITNKLLVKECPQFPTNRCIMWIDISEEKEDPKILIVFVDVESIEIVLTLFNVDSFTTQNYALYIPGMRSLARGKFIKMLIWCYCLKEPNSGFEYFRDQVFHNIYDIDRNYKDHKFNIFHKRPTQQEMVSRINSKTQFELFGNSSISNHYLGPDYLH